SSTPAAVRPAPSRCRNLRAFAKRSRAIASPSPASPPHARPICACSSPTTAASRRSAAGVPAVTYAPPRHRSATGSAPRKPCFALFWDNRGLDGAIIVDKPEGWTSHDVVGKMRRIARTKKIGHLGTLDPIATGVLPLVIGRATRLAQFYTRSDKIYEGLVRF